MTEADEMAYAAVALAALAEHGIPPDTIEMLLRGHAKAGIPRGAIYKAVQAIVEQIEIQKSAKS